MEYFFFPCALLCGFGLDLLFGDPERMPHPVRWMGRLIVAGEIILRGSTARTDTFSDLSGSLLDKSPNGIGCSPRKGDRRRGAVLVAIVLAVTALVSAAVVWVCFLAHPLLAFAVCAVMSWLCISARGLDLEARRVREVLETGDLDGARREVSRIVGRDTGALDEEGVAKAAVETVAENTADGVIAPLFYLAIGGPFGPCLGMVFKAVNTLDSMIGYKNERYLDFGRAAARLDDGFGFAPARLGALCMILACWLAGRGQGDGRGALRIWRRDRRNHASPNAAQCEAALAGALGVALAGDASYFGKIVRKPVIGDAGRPVTACDIMISTRLMYGTSLLFLPVAFFISLGISAVFFNATGLVL